MPIIPLPIVGGTSGSRRIKVGRGRLVNAYVESSEAGEAIVQFPGTKLHTTLPGPVRGFHKAFGRWFVATAGQIHEVFLNGTTSYIGGLTTSSGPVSFAHNIHEVCVVDGIKGYTIQKAATTMVEITDPQFPTNPIQVGFLDGYGIIIEGKSGRFHYTTIDDFETIDGADFATAEGHPDDLVGHMVDHRELWLAGKDSMEIWSTVSATPPIQRRPDGFVEKGCAAGFSLAKMDNTVFWLGSDLEPYRADGTTPINISDPLISSLIRDTTAPETAIGTTFEFDRHKFYQLTIPGELTIRYDAATGRWHEAKMHDRDD